MIYDFEAQRYYKISTIIIIMICLEILEQMYNELFKFGKRKSI
jgi:hypothetical protein